MQMLYQNRRKELMHHPPMLANNKVPKLNRDKAGNLSYSDFLRDAVTG